MKNTNNRSGSVSAVTTKETNLKVFSDKDVAEMSIEIEVLEDLLDKEKGSVRPYSDEDLKNRAKVFVSNEYQSNSFEMKIDRNKGIVWAVPAFPQEKIEANSTVNKEDERLARLKRALEYNWTFYATGYNCSIISALDPKGWNPIIAKTDTFLAEHICKTHNDWLNFKTKNGEKKVKKGNLRRLKNLAWRMKTFRDAFKLIEKNNYLGFASIKLWIEQNEDDVNQWIFTKWLKNSSNYEDWTWFFNNQGNFIHNIAPNEYSEICDSCEFIDYFRFGKDKSMNGVPEGEWDSYTFHNEYESKLFADGKNFTAALVLEKMFEFAEEYVKHTGWITGEMADKYHIDLHLVEVNADSDVLLDKMDPDTANRVRKIVEESDNKFFEKNPELKGEDINFKKPLEQRVDNLEKMIKDIWTNICADKRQV